MRMREIMAEAKPQKPVKPKKPKQPSGTVKPLTPDQARSRADKQQAASAKLNDVKAKASIDVAAAQRKLMGI